MGLFSLILSIAVIVTACVPHKDNKDRGFWLLLGNYGVLSSLLLYLEGNVCKVTNMHVVLILISCIVFSSLLYFVCNRKKNVRG